MLNAPGDMSAKPLGKGRGQHGGQRWFEKYLPTCSAKQFGQHIFQGKVRHNPDTTQTPQGKVRHNPNTL